MTEILRSATALLRGNNLDGAGSCLVVSFMPWAAMPTLDTNGWAERLCASRSWPALHLIPSSNDWYQSQGVLDAIAVAAGIARRYERVVTYGSSMGGYAALNFAKELNASAALAIVPQFSIDRAKVPFEARWAGEAGRTRFIADQVPSIGREIPAVIAYDPFFKPDVRHAELISEVSNAVRIRLPLMGHSGPGSVILKELLAMAREGRIDDMRSHAIEKHRAFKKTTANYYLQLANQARGLSASARLRLLDRASAIEPLSIGIAIQRSRHLLAQNLNGDALAVQDEALRRVPRTPLLWSHKAQALARLSRSGEAIEAASQAAALAPQNSYFQHQLASLLLASKRYREAEEHQERAVGLDRSNAAYARQLELIRQRRALTDIEPGASDNAASVRVAAGEPAASTLVQ